MDTWVIIILVCLILLVMVLFMVIFSIRKGKNQRQLLQEVQMQQQHMMDDMSQRVNQELMQFQTLLHQGMQSDLHMLREDTTQRLFSMEKSMGDSLKQQLQTTGTAFSTMMGEMGKLGEAQKHLQSLSYDINDLQKILNDKKTRGIFGEIELYSLLENTMGENMQRYGKQVKLSNGMIADAVVYASDPMGMIAVDSKFPLENYQRMLDVNLSKDEQRKAQTLFIGDVKKHIKTIHDKYIIPHETAEFAFLFLPAESLFSYIHGNLQDVVSYSFEQQVYLVSPTTLMAYLTAIKAIYLGQQRNQNIQAIQSELKHLAVEFERFDKRFQSVTTDFERSYNDMRQVSITAQKLIHRFQAIQNVEVHQDEKE